MKFLIFLAASLAIATSAPFDGHFTHVTQDTAGNYKLHYNIPEITRTETGSSDGSVVGSYSYVDGDGKSQTLQFTSGVQGFVAQGSNLPVAPAAEPENPDVVNARNEHLATYHEVLSKLPITEEFDQSLKHINTVKFVPRPFAPSPASSRSPVRYVNIVVPVFAADTPEVVAAKIEHQAALSQALRNLQ